MDLTSKNRLFRGQVFVSIEDAASAGFFRESIPDTLSNKFGETKGVASTSGSERLFAFDCRLEPAALPNAPQSPTDGLSKGGANQYLEVGHIPNAIFVGLAVFGSSGGGGKGSKILPPTTDFIEKVLMRAGVGGGGDGLSSSSSESQSGRKRDVCLCYDDDNSCGAAAARVWWMLNSLGVEAYILDGGIQLYDAVTCLSSRTRFKLPLQIALPPITTAKPVVLSDANAIDPKMTLTSLSSWPYATEWSNTTVACLPPVTTGIPFGHSSSASASACALNRSPSTNFDIPTLPTRVAPVVRVKKITTTAVAPAVYKQLSRQIAAEQKLPMLRPVCELRAEFIYVLHKHNRMRRAKLNIPSSSASEQRPLSSDSAEIFLPSDNDDSFVNIAVAAHCGLFYSNNGKMEVGGPKGENSECIVNTVFPFPKLEIGGNDSSALSSHKMSKI